MIFITQAVAIPRTGLVVDRMFMWICWPSLATSESEISPVKTSPFFLPLH